MMIQGHKGVRDTPVKRTPHDKGLVASSRRFIEVDGGPSGCVRFAWERAW